MWYITIWHKACSGNQETQWKTNPSPFIQPIGQTALKRFKITLCLQKTMRRLFKAK